MITTKSTMQLYDIVERLSISPADIRKELFVMLIREFSGDVDLLECFYDNNEMLETITEDDDFVYEFYKRNKNKVLDWIEEDNDN